jgi:hypothetical protein
MSDRRCNSVSASIIGTAEGTAAHGMADIFTGSAITASAMDHPGMAGGTASLADSGDD